MWGEVLNENILFKAATSTNQMDPGIVARFNNGVLARYIQGSATLDNDTLAAGEPCLLALPGTAYDDSRYTSSTHELGQKLYVASNVSDGTGVTTGLAVGAFLMAGIATVAIPESYWGWALIYGYCSYMRCYDATVAQYEYLVLDNATATVNGMSLKNADADGQTAYGFSWAADDGTANTVAGFFDARGIGCMFDIA